MKSIEAKTEKAQAAIAAETGDYETFSAEEVAASAMEEDGEEYSTVFEK